MVMIGLRMGPFNRSYSLAASRQDTAFSGVLLMFSVFEMRFTAANASNAKEAHKILSISDILWPRISVTMRILAW